MSATYNDTQLDALRELANIGAGNASTALSGMLGRSVDLRVPDARLLPMHEAVESIGAPESEITGIALGEVGNIVGSSYINALAEMTGMAIEPTPPATATDMLGAVVQTVLAGHAHAGDIALMLDSNLTVEGEDCSISFLLVPEQGGFDDLLSRIGLS